MCGIAGFVTRIRSSEAQPIVRRMMGSLARRGPDSEGLESWSGDEVVLGHRRLAILDLSPAGHQPMLSRDGDTGVVFNGCIYNFLDIRAELEQLGHKFRSQCDTEILVTGYRQWGLLALVRRLRGMFAFGIWDQKRRVLSLARDRLGVKPLIYSRSSTEIAFASQVSALRKAGFGGEIHPQAVLSLLHFGFVPDDQCIYTGIEKLPPATIAEWHDGEWSQQTYWSLPEGATATVDFEEAVEETERLLIESVRLRLISDVPIGVLLSGGIDSALVCWALTQLNSRIQSFTVGAPGDASDESGGAKTTAKILGIPHEVVTLPEQAAPMETLLQAYSEPFPCQSALGMLQVSAAVKNRGVTVLLTGDGGDDVFLGYPFFYHAWLGQRLAQGLPPGSGLLRNLLPPWGPLRRARNFLGYATGGLGAFSRAREGVVFYRKRDILGKRLQTSSLPSNLQPEPSRESAQDLLREVFRFHLRTTFVGEFMPKVDGGTMYESLEARAPFLDQNLWEFAATLSPNVLLRNGALKAVLREIVRRRISPEVANRPKQGFTIPVERWLARNWRGELSRIQSDSLLERQGWIRPGSLKQPIQEALARDWVPQQIWYLLVLDYWLGLQD